MISQLCDSEKKSIKIQYGSSKSTNKIGDRVEKLLPRKLGSKVIEKLIYYFWMLLTVFTDFQISGVILDPVTMFHNYMLENHLSRKP